MFLVPENLNLQIIRFSCSLSHIILHLRVSCIYRHCIVTGFTFRKDCHVENYRNFLTTLIYVRFPQIFLPLMNCCTYITVAEECRVSPILLN